MIEVNSGNTIIDNTWLWRADHDASGRDVKNSRNPNKHGIVVNGDNVIIYGLAVEHALNENVIWNGNNGKVHFF